MHPGVTYIIAQESRKKFKSGRFVRSLKQEPRSCRMFFCKLHCRKKHCKKKVRRLYIVGRNCHCINVVTRKCQWYNFLPTLLIPCRWKYDFMLCPLPTIINPQKPIMGFHRCMYEYLPRSLLNARLSDLE